MLQDLVIPIILLTHTHTHTHTHTTLGIYSIYTCARNILYFNRKNNSSLFFTYKNKTVFVSFYKFLTFLSRSVESLMLVRKLTNISVSLLSQRSVRFFYKFTRGHLANTDFRTFSTSATLFAYPNHTVTTRRNDTVTHRNNLTPYRNDPAIYRNNFTTRRNDPATHRNDFAPYRNDPAICRNNFTTYRNDPATHCNNLTLYHL